MQQQPVELLPDMAELVADLSESQRLIEQNHLHGPSIYSLITRPWQGVVGKSFKADNFHNYVAGLPMSSWRPQFVVLHNTAEPTLADWHDVPGSERMKNLAAFYKSKHWSAGPHLFIADDLIWVFTPLTTHGIHSPSWNNVSWGVEMVGNYVQGGDNVNQAVLYNTISALATLHYYGKINPKTLRLHREDPLTTHACPGSLIVPMKQQIIDQVTNTMSTWPA